MHLRLRADQLSSAAAVLRGLVLALAVATAAAASLGSGVEPWRLAAWLADHGGLALAVALGWLVLAPVPLAAAALAHRRTPWPWVGTVTVHLLVPVVLAARFPHLLPGWAWLVVALSVAAGLGSVVTAFPARSSPEDGRPGS